jgi:hypothetical protein
MLVVPFAYAHQKPFVATGMLLRHKSHPGSHMPPILELFAVTDSGDNSGCRFGADTANPGDPLAIWICPKDLIDAPVKGFDP